jgi:metal-dependent hydrolase (beta-lactamase superfamily II)
MKKYKTIKNLDAIEFRRLTGIHCETFQEMVLLLKKLKQQEKQEAGNQTI